MISGKPFLSDYNGHGRGLVHSMNPKNIRVLLPLLISGCFSGPRFSDEGFFETGFGQEECLQFDSNMLNFGSVSLSELPVEKTIEYIDNCSLLNGMLWSLDDPDGAFSFHVVSTQKIRIRLQPETAGEWEAQFVAEHESMDRLREVVQLFGETTENSEEP